MRFGKMKIFLTTIFCLFLVFHSHYTAFADEKVEVIKNKIVREKQKIREISKEELKLMDELDAMGKKLFEARRQTRALVGEIDLLQGKIQEHSGQKKKLLAELSANREYTAARLNAMYRLNGAGRGSTPESFFDFLKTRNSLHRVLQSDVAAMEEQAKRIAALEKIERQLSQAIALESAKQVQLEHSIRKIQADSEKKEELLQRILQEKDLALAALKSLERSAEKLDHTVTSLGSPGKKEVAGKGFSAHKGRLAAPVSGRILSAYGRSPLENGKGFYFQSGIDISAQYGTPVRSIFRGEVIYSDWLQGYGNLLIVNHGDHYYSLYAHVEETFKKIGEQVDTGEVIATTGDTGSMKGPCLHFEIRHHGKPVNPAKWLEKGV